MHHPQFKIVSCIDCCSKQAAVNKLKINMWEWLGAMCFGLLHLTRAKNQQTSEMCPVCSASFAEDWFMDYWNDAVDRFYKST